MKNKRRFLALVLTLSMLLVALTGCAATEGNPISPSTEAETKTETTTPDAQESSTPSETEDKVLTVWTWDEGFNGIAINTAMAFYQKEHPDVSLNVTYFASWRDFKDQFITVCQAGLYEDLPDIFLVSDYGIEVLFRTYPDAFADLTDTGIDFSQFAPGKISFATFDDRIYGVPFDNGIAVGAYRVDFLEAAGYTTDDVVDVTWEELIQIATDVRAATGKPLFYFQSGTADMIMTMARSCGESLFDENGKATIAGNEALVEILGVIKKMVECGGAEMTSSYDEWMGGFVNGKCGGVLEGCWILATVKTAEDQSGKWFVSNYPSLKSGTASNYSSNGGCHWMVAKTSDKIDLAADFLGSTFAGSVEFYETILPAAAAIGTWAPCLESDIYAEPQEFFGGQDIYADIMEYSKHMEPARGGAYYYEVNDALAVAFAEVMSGMSIEDALENAQNTIDRYQNQ